MRNISCKTLILIIVFFFNWSFAFGEGLAGRLSSRKNISESFKEGEKQSSSESLSNNLNFKFSKPITQMILYSINFSASWKDSESTNAAGMTTNTYGRSVSPSISFSLGNRMYNLSVGYDRGDSWSTANLSEESRQSEEFYYSRFGLHTEYLPSLNMRASRKVPDTKLELTEDHYSIGSSYDLPSDDIDIRYSVNFSRSELKDPSSLLERRVGDNFRSGYSIGYNNGLFGDIVNYSIGYKGNFSRNKSRQFATQSGSVLFERAPTGGLFALGSPGNENVDVLSSKSFLVDEDLELPNVSDDEQIDLGNDQFNNIGIWVSPDETVDRLFIYVNKDVTTDAALTNAANWKIYKSDFNQAGTWVEHSIAGVTPRVVSTIDNIYRYEITFLSEQTASFFKAVNMVTSDVFDLTVTEIEAHGTDIIPDTNVRERVTRSFAQGLNFSASGRPLSKITVSFNYSLDRRDSNPISVPDSFVGIITNIYSDEITGEKQSFNSDVTRNYGISAFWAAHELITARIGFSENDNFDDKKSTDIRSSTYSFSLVSSPLPTLSTNLILTRSEDYVFDEKRSVSHSMFMNVGSNLYKGINMVSDFGFTQSEDLFDGTESSTRFLAGVISARITRKLSGSLGFNINWSDGVTRSKGSHMRFNYRPAGKINLSGDFSISSAEDNVSISEGISISWIPLRALRFSMNMRRKESDPGPVIEDRISTYSTWNVTEFADIRFAYNYTRKKQTIKTEGHGFSTNFDCRF
jgi:hypothetical protein